MRNKTAVVCTGTSDGARACVMRFRLTLARTLSLCCVRAMARVGPAAEARVRRLVVGIASLAETVADAPEVIMETQNNRGRRFDPTLGVSKCP